MPEVPAFALQLYSLRALGDPERVFGVTAEAGFRFVEIVGAHLESPAETRARLERHDLEAISSHVALEVLGGDKGALVEACRLLAIDQVVMPAVPMPRRSMDAGGWRALGAELGRLAEALEKDGIALGYHNHDWELEAKEGERTALELLFEAAGSSPLRLQPDIAWLVRAGQDPLAWLERYRKRLLSVHLKDLAAPGSNLEEGGWAELGEGTMDWPALIHGWLALSSGWMIVEHDRPADPAGFAARAHAYLQSLEG